MVEIGTLLSGVENAKRAWELISKALPPRSKVAEIVHDEMSFLALMKPKRREPVRVVDARNHRYEFKVVVDEVVFEPRVLRSDQNRIVFHFTQEPPEHDWQNTHAGFFGKRHREKARMLRQGDQIIIRGYFNLKSVFGLIFIREIERL
jgi:hypothetical protein